MKINLIFLLVLTITLTGCFNNVDVEVDGLKGSMVNVDGIKQDEMDSSTITISVKKGKHLISLYKQLNSKSYSYGEKEIEAKEKKLKIKIKTHKFSSNQVVQELNEIDAQNKVLLKKERESLNEQLISSAINLEDLSAKDIVKYNLLNNSNIPGQLLKTIDTGIGLYSGLYKTTMSSDGKIAFSAGGGSSVSSKLIFWKLKSGESNKFRGWTNSIGIDVAISLDNKNVLSLTDTGYGTVTEYWNIKNHKLLKELENPKDRYSKMYCIALSPDRKYALGGSRDNTIKIWNLKSGKFIRTLKGHTDSVNSIVISKDRKYILSSGSWDKTVRLWDFKSGKTLKILKGHKSKVTSVAISKDSKYALSGSNDDTIRYWDLNTGKTLQILKGHNGTVNSVAISSDGKYALSASNDDTIRYWDLSTGKTLQILKGHTNDVWSISISNDGYYALSGSRDGTMKLWALNAKLIYKIKSIKEFIKNGGYKIYPINSIKIMESSKEFFGDSYGIKVKVAKLLENRYQLSIRHTLKEGVIGKRYVPSTSSSYYTHDTDTTYINGKSYITSKSHKQNNSNGGYDEKIHGYTAIYEVTNTSPYVYILNFNASWNGKYSKYITKKYSFWSSNSGTYSEKKSKMLDATHPFGMLIEPGEKIKYQFAVGEKKPTNLVNVIESAKKITRKEYDAFKSVMSKQNQNIELLSRFIKNKNYEKWHSILKAKKAKLFDKEYKNKVKISISFDKENYDADFENDVSINITTPKKMKVYYTTDFGIKETVVVDGVYNKTFKLKGKKINTLSASVRNIYEIN